MVSSILANGGRSCINASAICTSASFDSDTMVSAPLEIIDKVNYRADGLGYIKPGYSQVFVVNSAGGAPRQLTFGAFNHNGPISFTPDARTLLFSGNRNADWERDALEADIYAVDLVGGAVRALTTRNGPDIAPMVTRSLGVFTDSRLMRSRETLRSRRRWWCSPSRSGSAVTAATLRSSASAAAPSRPG